MGKKILLISITAILVGLIFAVFIISESSYFPTNESREIIIDAERFKYTPSEVSVKRGERIKIVINNTDVPHGIIIPELGISGDDSVEFAAEKSGEFAFYCNNFCGQEHQQMQGKLIVK